LLKSDPEKLTFRISAHQLVQNGFRENESLQRDDSNERDELTTRLKLRWLANDDWSLDGQLLYSEVDNGYDEFTLSNERTDTYSDEPGRDEQETLGGSLRATWVGQKDVDLVTVTSYTTTDSLYSFDGDWGVEGAPAPFASFYTDFLTLDRERDVISQEIRFNSKAQQNALGLIDRWTIGVYIQVLDEESYAVWDSGAIWDTDFESESIALFGQAIHEFNDQTRLKLQLRVEHYEVDVAANGDFYSTLFDYALDSSDTLWGGNITLEHDLSAGTQTHISLIRGYKAGGASTPNFTDARDITYDSETLWTIETGVRSSFFENSVDASVTAFYTYREDPQFRDSEGSGSFFDYITTNGDSAIHYGLEGQAIWYFAKNWSFGGTVGLLEAERSDYTARGVSVDSRDVSNAPNYTYSARLDYAPKDGHFASLELVGSDEYYESNSHTEKRSAFAVVNASIGYRYENWTFTLWSKNLLDEESEERVFFFDNGAGPQRYEAPAAPRTFGVTANYRW
jgi:outer membrane receptor protein involved in Fe transport